jgi:polyphosphate kinase 2 (PPK2 family)
MMCKAYDEELCLLQVELVSLQLWVKQSGARICIVFEGPDTAGKAARSRRQPRE